MTKKERSQIYADYLKGEGYTPQIDNDDDVIFKAEGKTYLIYGDAKDEEFFRLVFPSFWPIESEAERAKAEKAASYATAEAKVTKVYVVRDNVWAAIELFCSPVDAFKPVFKRSMSALMFGVTKFVEKMREQS